MPLAYLTRPKKMTMKMKVKSPVYPLSRWPMGEIPESEYAETQPGATNSASTARPPLGTPPQAIRQKKEAPPRSARRTGSAPQGRRIAHRCQRKLSPNRVESQPPPQRPEVSAPLPFRQPQPQAAEFERPAPSSGRRLCPFDPRPVEAPSPAPAPQLPSERTAHGRAGDPALASRMAQLESMLRRLLSSPLRRLDDVEQAPAGPGVFLLSDSDQITSYYVEACQTLRVGLGNLLRGGRSSKSNNRGGRSYSESGLKSKLAEHLGINESKVGQYMKDHCVVRWIQLDDDAPHLAHFAIGVLRTPLNLE